MRSVSLCLFCPTCSILNYSGLIFFTCKQIYKIQTIVQRFVQLAEQDHCLCQIAFGHVSFALGNRVICYNFQKPLEGKRVGLLSIIIASCRVMCLLVTFVEKTARRSIQFFAFFAGWYMHDQARRIRLITKVNKRRCGQKRFTAAVCIYFQSDLVCSGIHADQFNGALSCIKWALYKYLTGLLALRYYTIIGYFRVSCCFRIVPADSHQRTRIFKNLDVGCLNAWPENKQWRRQST